MAANSRSLTAIAIRNAKPGDKPKRLYDSGGLYLEVMPTGARYWRLKYRFGGKEKRLALGVYPGVSLASARAQRDAARVILQKGSDPSEERKAEKVRAKLSSSNTFESIAMEWLELQRGKLAAVTVRKAEWLLGMAFVEIGSRPIADVSVREIIALLRKVEVGGRHETAHRVKQSIGRVFRYAISTDRANRDPAADVREGLAPVVTTSRAALTKPAAVGTLLRDIDSYQGQPTTVAALKLAPLLFVRPGNLRAMEWVELDLSAGEWRIPKGKMKMGEAHFVPLAPQAIAILLELQTLTGRGRYCFPGLRTADRPMSENTINAALRRLGYDKHTMTGHGFRAMASTRLNEMGWAPDVIERQLAHAERNKVRAAYNRAAYVPERKAMMLAWADYLDVLREDARG